MRDLVTVILGSERRRAPVFVTACLLTCSLFGQSPSYRLQAAAQPGGTLDSLVVGRPGQAFVTWVDASGGPASVLGETIWLGLTAALGVLDAGVLDGVGARTMRLGVPNLPALSGLVLFGQVVALDPSSPNGRFRTSNGESAGIWRGSRAVVLRFDDVVAEGFTGSFDAAVKGRLQAEPPSRRTVQAVDVVNGVRFGQPLLNPLNPNGVRMQAVLRARDLKATGEEELVTAVRWRPFDGKIVADTFPRATLDLSHSRVVPDFRVDSFSGLPIFPESGLARSFAQNQFGPAVRVYDGPYALRPADVRPDGYVAYPAPQQHFAYNGIDSLLLDYRVAPSATAMGVNGHVVYLMVTSMSKPDARVLSGPGDPFQQTMATSGDNTMYDLQVELTKVKRAAYSPWIAVGGTPSYDPPIAATTGPSGTAVMLRFRGAMDALGNGAGGWGAVTAASGFPFLQVEVTTQVLVTGEVPSIDTLIVPIR